MDNMHPSDEKWAVVYAKILLDKDEGVELQGIYFGGIGDTIQDAETIARECVNIIKGGTIMPRIVKITSDNYSIIDALYDVADKFESTTKRMRDAESILRRNKK